MWWAGQNGLGRAVGVVERTGLVSEASFGPEQDNKLFTPAQQTRGALL